MKKTLTTIFINIIFILILGEVVSRIFPKLFDPPPPYNTAILDDKLGWLQKEGYEYEGEQSSLNGEKYEVKLSFEDNGFRKYSSKSNDSVPRILIIGDSFTQAIEVSDGKAYYDELEKGNSFEVYAYGLAGYGTLQEYMVLDEYFDIIKPEIVVIQFCSNDFIDNELEVEKTAIYRVGLRRPYLEEDGSICYENPLSKLEQILLNSKFMKFGINKWGRLKHKLGIKKQNSSEEKIVKEGDRFEPYKRSQIITGKILEKIKSRIGNKAKLLLMNVDIYEPQETDLAKICAAQDISLIKFPKAAMQKARVKDEVYTLDGFHWNEKGHKVIGENLKRKLQNVKNGIDK